MENEKTHKNIQSSNEQNQNSVDLQNNEPSQECLGQKETKSLIISYFARNFKFDELELFLKNQGEIKNIFTDEKYYKCFVEVC